MVGLALGDGFGVCEGCGCGCGCGCGGEVGAAHAAILIAQTTKHVEEIRATHETQRLFRFRIFRSAILTLGARFNKVRYANCLTGECAAIVTFPDDGAATKAFSLTMVIATRGSRATVHSAEAERLTFLFDSLMPTSACCLLKREMQAVHA